MSLVRWVALAGRRWWRAATVLVLVATLATLAGWRVLRNHVGDPADHLADDWHRGHRIEDREGRLLRELPTEQGRRGRPLGLAEIGPRLIGATLAAEDADFFEHDGIDRIAIARAIEQNVRHGRLVSGASTISQQLVKLLDTAGVPGPRTLPIKLREAARAQNLESRLTKDQILEAYLNRLPYGRGWVGPEVAAHGYFGRRPADLSWGQATFLAVIPRAPSYLDPYRHPERVRSRQRALLDEMAERGMLTPHEAERAWNEPIELRPLAHAFEAPHFLVALQGEGRLSSGDTTSTTLDLELQRDIEGLTATHLAALRARRAHNAAVLVLGNATGDILAWVGSADFDDAAIDGQVDMVTARRQPGSTLKPFVYALAFDSGVTGAQMLADVPTEFIEGPGSHYAPANFHENFSGPVSARTALATSLNVPAVRLAADLPDGRLLEFLRQLGLRSLDQSSDHYGLSLALGSGEVELRELANSYATLARGGLHRALRFRLDDPMDAGTRVLEQSIAAAVTEALADPLARVGLLSGRSPFDIGFPVALKTGTSSGFRDTWTVGYTAERTVAVWIGNADGAATADLTGGTGAGPLFADVMRRAMRDVSTREPLWDPGALVSAEVCALSGHRPGPACPHRVVRRFAPAHAPRTDCTVHHRARRIGASIRWTCDAAGPSTVAVLPDSFSEWLDERAPGAPGHDPDDISWISRGHITGCGFEGMRPAIRLVSPTEGSVFFRMGDGADVVELRARFEGSTSRPIETVEFVVDGVVVARAPAEAPRALVELGPGDHEVYARPRDGAIAVELDTVRFSVR